ncbi:MAG TPA: hypothetical protein QF564_02465, partial [Pirellulaceae bacterium]|nr:hypothetical protein [Pirellulaceae bacterium]
LPGDLPDFFAGVDDLAAETRDARLLTKQPSVRWHLRTDNPVDSVGPPTFFVYTHALRHNTAISHDILEFSARVLTQWGVSFPNALDA